MPAPTLPVVATLTFTKSAQRPRWILPTIVFTQFACTSLWFAGNAVLPDLLREVRLEGTSLGAVVPAVQMGFIVGTLLLVLPRPAFGAAVLVWGMAVVADSP